MDDEEKLGPVPSGGANQSRATNYVPDEADFGPETVAMAFSGGGIRSAAFCSGVLKKVLDDGVEVSHMSCVSGGGYIGSSFAEWVAQARYRGAAANRHRWCRMAEVGRQYFQHLEQNYALYCNWQDDFPRRGIYDSVMFVSTALLSFFLLPMLALLTFVPSALRVDAMFGDYMRHSFVPRDDCMGSSCGGHVHTPILGYSLATTLLGGVTMAVARRFHARRHILFALLMWLGVQMSLVGALILAACLFEVSARNAAPEAGVGDDGDFDIALYGGLALVVLYGLLWTMVPGSPLNRRLGHVVAILAVSRFIQWRVFGVPADETGESQEILRSLILVTAIVLLCMVVLGPLRFTLPFLYNRSRLQKFLFENRKDSVKKPVAASFGLSSFLMIRPLAEPAIGPEYLVKLRHARCTSMSGSSEFGSTVYIMPEDIDAVPGPWSVETSVNGTNGEEVVVGQPLITLPSPFAADGPQPGEDLPSKGGVSVPGSGSRANGNQASENGHREVPARQLADGSSVGEDATDMAVFGGHIGVDLEAGLTLADVQGTTCGDFELLSQVVVNKWRFTHDTCESNCKLMVLSSSSIDVISTTRANEAATGVRLDPGKIQIADAMALSGAALSLNNGLYNESFAMMAFRGLQLLFGMAIGTSMLNTNTPTTVSHYRRVAAVTMTIYILLSGAVFCQGMGIGGCWPLYTEIIVSSFVTIAALLPSNPKDMNSSLNVSLRTHGPLAYLANGLCHLTRCVNLHVHAAFLVRELLDIDTVGLDAPCVFSLSDGGHVENLGLLPLLHRRCPRIVIADGSCYADTKDVASSLLLAMDMARAWLKCSFTARDGGDIMADIREKLTVPGECGKRLPHSYRFCVIYPPEDGQEVEVGEIVMLQPRHPTQRASGSASGRLAKDPLNENILADQLDDLTGCCCQCCHGRCHSLSYWLIGRFPAISTLAQGFTPDLFKAFQEEGERAASSPDAARLWLQHHKKKMN